MSRGRLPMASVLARVAMPDAPVAVPDQNDDDLAKGETESAETESGETESGGDHMEPSGFASIPGLDQEAFVDPHQTFLPEPPFIPTVIPPDGLRA